MLNENLFLCDKSIRSFGIGETDILGPEFVSELRKRLAIVALGSAVGVIGGKLIGDRINQGGGVVGALVGGVGIGAVTYAATKPTVTQDKKS